MSDYQVHPSSYVDATTSIGSGTKIWHFCNIQGNANIGANCVLGQNVNVGPRVRIGNNCKIQNNVAVYSGVTLEDDVFCGPSMVFTNVFNPRAHINRKDEFLETLVKRGATLGANCTIVSGVTIGEYALVGAGAVVTKSLQPHGLYYGVPARHHGFVCDCGEILLEDLRCSRCGLSYTKSGPETIVRANVI